MSETTNKVAVRIRVELADGQFVMVPVRVGVPARVQADAIRGQYGLGADPGGPVDALAARIQSALDDYAQQATPPQQSNARRLLREGVDAAPDVAELSYREFPLRLDDTDDEDDESDGVGDGPDDGWEPRRPAPSTQRNVGDDLIVHVMINDHDEAVLTVPNGAEIAVAVDGFVAQYGLSPAKRQLLTDHVLAHLPLDGSVGADVVVAVVTVMVQDRFLDRLEIRSHDDLVQRLQDFADRNEFQSVQRRRLTASLFVNMERVELSQDRDRCPATFVIRLDTIENNVDDVLCDDDLMSMLDVDRVLAFCDRRQIATRTQQRHALVQAIAASRLPTAEIVTPNPCLVLNTHMARFELFDGDDVLEKIGAFCDHQGLGDEDRFDVVADVVRALSPRTPFDAAAALEFADRHHLSHDRQARLRLMIEIDRFRSRSTPTLTSSSSMPMSDRGPIMMKSHRRSKSSQSKVFHRLYAEHLIRKRRSAAAASTDQARHERRPSSARSAVCDRLYTEGLKFLHRRHQSSSAQSLDLNSELTFRPHLFNDTHRYRHQQHHRRQFSSGRISSRTQQRQLQYLIERQHQEMSACTFRPEIRTDHQPGPGPVHERLYRDGQVRSQRQAALQAVAEEIQNNAGVAPSSIDANLIDRLHNHNLYRKQAIESFRQRYHDYDADGNRLFHIRDYMGTSITSRMQSDKVAEYLHSTPTQASRPPPSDSAPAPANPIEARSNALIRKAIQSRLRRLYSVLVHDGLIDALSALRIKSDQSQIPSHLRTVVKNVVVQGTAQGRTMNFDQFAKQVLQACQCTGVLPSDFIEKAQSIKEPALTKQSGKKKSDRDVFSELYEGSRTLKDRRFILQYKARALESGRSQYENGVPLF